MASSIRIEHRQVAPGQYTLEWYSNRELVLATSCPVLLESEWGPIPPSINGHRKELLYEKIENSSSGITATTSFADQNGVTGSISDTWKTSSSTSFSVTRTVRIQDAFKHAGLRVGLEFQPIFPEGLSFNDLEYYAPNACYNLNDLNEDGYDDYLDTQTLSYREDRLNALSVMAYHPVRQVAFSISRSNIPRYDDEINRKKGQTSFLQDTDIGSIGFRPNRGEFHNAIFTTAYPFVERDRCNALLVEKRVPWGAFRPVKAGDEYIISYTIRLYHASSAHEALWYLLHHQYNAMNPSPVKLDHTLEHISSLRLKALSRYFMEDSAGGAGFVTNCHPQDGKQLGNVIQYGFTGLNIMNAGNLLRISPRDSENYVKAMKVINFYTHTAAKSPFGFTHGLYNMDLQRHDSWWTGLLLPLAYANPGDDLERLMGPLYSHRQAIVKALAGTHGIYLRCVLEETEALLTLYSTTLDAPKDWLTIAHKFGDFLLEAQGLDGSWARAFSMNGESLTEPDFWFGQTKYQQRSSTATVIPFLLHLSAITGNQSYKTAAIKAGRFVRTELIDKVKHNGGIHDSIYAKPQLVDHESIYFCCRAMLALYESVGGDYFRTSAVRAAQLSASWILLWDIPLPPRSTLATSGFRSTGWAGCDVPGAGYFHPMGIIAVPDLISVGLLTHDLLFINIAELCMYACNENVGRKWGYAMEGLQEEGVLLAPWFLDDPMFGEETGFGGRRKGEGNKTCLPWISAVTVWAVEEVRRRFGTLDFDVLRDRALGKVSTEQNGNDDLMVNGMH